MPHRIGVIPGDGPVGDSPIPGRTLERGIDLRLRFVLATDPVPSRIGELVIERL